MTRSGRDDRTDLLGTLDIDISCTRCGYNLRSLAVDGQCPECSALVSASLDADRLMFADPSWLSRISRGLSVVLWSIIVSGASVVFVNGGVSIWESQGRTLPGTRTAFHEFEGGHAKATYNPLPDFVPFAMKAVSAAAIMLGVYLSTTRDKSNAASGIGQRRRRATRILAVVCGLLALAPVVLFNQVGIIANKLPNGIYVGSAMPTLRAFLDFALIISFATVVLVIFYWLACLAGRIPDGRLVRWCRRFGVVTAAVMLLIFGLQAIPGLRTPVFGISLFRILLVALVANVIGIVVLLVAYRRTLRRLIPACLSYQECFAHEGRPSPQRPVDAGPTGDPNE